MNDKRFEMGLGFEIVCNGMSLKHVTKFCAHTRVYKNAIIFYKTIFGQIS